MVPSGSFDPLLLTATCSGTVPLVGLAEATSTGGWFVVVLLAAITNSVTLCGGTVATKLDPPKLKSARRVIEFDDVSCHACAAPLAAKLAKFSVIGVAPERTLLTTITVSAPSLERCAANTESASGSGALAATLVSPKPDRLPS